MRCEKMVNVGEFAHLEVPDAFRPTPDWLGGNTLLDWSWAVERLDDERNYWVTTIRRGGFPQARPVWGVWTSAGLLLSIGHGGVQRAEGAPPLPVTVHVDSAVDVVIIEGELHRLTSDVSMNEEDAQDALDRYNAKYSWNMEAGGLNFLARPHRAYGWSAEDVTTATRWQFG